jgi:hypothetical protein
MRSKGARNAPRPTPHDAALCGPMPQPPCGPVRGAALLSPIPYAAPHTGVFLSGPWFWFSGSIYSCNYWGTSSRFAELGLEVPPPLKQQILGLRSEELRRYRPPFSLSSQLPAPQPLWISWVPAGRPMPCLQRLRRVLEERSRELDTHVHCMIGNRAKELQLRRLIGCPEGQ